MGTDKALLVVDGIALARRVVDALAAGGATSVACVGGDLAGLQALGLVAIADDHPGAGPLGGVGTALSEARRVGAEVVVVAACDHRDLDGATVQAVVGALDREGADVGFAVARAADGHRPLIVALRRSLAERAATEAFAAGARSMTALYDRLTGVDVDDLDPSALRDVDRPTDLDKR